MSKRQRLARLVLEHPDWTSKQYAEVLGQSDATIRGVISSMKLKRSRKAETQTKPKVKVKLPNSKLQTTVASKCGPTRSGYTKLI